MGSKAKITSLAVLAMAVTALFLFWDVGRNWDYVLPRRGWKVGAMLITGACIAFATVVFQTITNNRILTPNIIGLDAMHMLTQTLVVYALGSTSQLLNNTLLNFLVTLVLMMLFAGGMYQVMFKREGSNIYHLLLVGMILGTLLTSLTTFMQVLIDPNEFLVLQGKMFATFNKVSESLTLIALAVLVLSGIYYARSAKYMDVLSLGKEHAINLGVPVDAVVKRMMVLVAVLISTATALVGPITFLGLIVANVSYQMMKTYRHAQLIPAAMLISVIALVGGQFVVEKVFTFTTTVSVIINLVGGVYFLYLLVKGKK